MTMAGVGGFEVAGAIGLRRDDAAIAVGAAVPGDSFLFAVALYRNS
jgi:hypothetical protein